MTKVYWMLCHLPPRVLYEDGMVARVDDEYKLPGSCGKLPYNNTRRKGLLYEYELLLSNPGKRWEGT